MDWAKVRSEINKYSDTGDRILSECQTLDERPACKNHAEKWFGETYSYLLTVDPGFAATFKTHTGFSFSTSIHIGNESKSIPDVNQSAVTLVTYKQEALILILQQIPVQ
jgi:hypothetical protein